MECIEHGILQTRILEWVAIPFSRGSSQPRDRTQVSCISGEFFTLWATREAQYVRVHEYKFVEESILEQTIWFSKNVPGQESFCY